MPGVTKSLYRESTPVTKSNYRGSPKAAHETRFLVPGALERVLVKKSSADSKAVIPSILLKPSPREKKGSIQVNNAYETLGIAYPETPGQRSNYRASPGQRSNYRESPIDHRSNYRESPGQRSDYRKPLGPGSNYTGGSKDKHHDGTSQSQSPSNSKERRDDKSHYGSCSSYRQSSHYNDSGLQSGYHSPRSNHPPSNYGSSGRDSYYQQRDDKGCCGCSRCICISIICAVVLMLGILAVLVVVFWYFLFSVHATSTTISTISTTKPVEDKVHFFKDVCIERMKSADVSEKECVAGSSPSKESCSEDGKCFFYTYKISKLGETYDLPDFTTSPSVSPGSSDLSRLLCLMNDGALGMCEKRECSLPYQGVELKDWKEEGWNKSSWLDNCDKPNPCWDNENLIKEYASKDMMTRDKCFTSSTEIDCPNTEADAGLWVQHLRCNHGKYRATKKVCDGLPIRYWSCGTCKKTQKSGPPTGCTLQASSCEYTCGGNPRTAKNGVQCKIADGKIWYCVHGKCKMTDLLRDDDKTRAKENCKKNL